MRETTVVRGNRLSDQVEAGTSGSDYRRERCLPDRSETAQPSGEGVQCRTDLVCSRIRSACSSTHLRREITAQIDTTESGIQGIHGSGQGRCASAQCRVQLGQTSANGTIGILNGPDQRHERCRGERGHGLLERRDSAIFGRHSAHDLGQRTNGTDTGRNIREVQSSHVGCVIRQSDTELSGSRDESDRRSFHRHAAKTVDDIDQRTQWSERRCDGIRSHLGNGVIVSSQTVAKLCGGSLYRTEIADLTEVALQNLGQRFDCRNGVLNGSDVDAISGDGFAISGKCFAESLQAFSERAPVLTTDNLLPPTVIGRNVLKDVVQRLNGWNRLLNGFNIDTISGDGFAISSKCLAHSGESGGQLAPVLAAGYLLPPTVIGRNSVQHTVQSVECFDGSAYRSGLKSSHGNTVHLQRHAHLDEAVG